MIYPAPAATLVVSVHMGTAVKVAVSVVSWLSVKLPELLLPVYEFPVPLPLHPPNMLPGAGVADRLIAVPQE